MFLDFWKKRILIVPFFVMSCVNRDIYDSGSVHLYKSVEKSSFSFTVSRSFIQDDNSKKDKRYPKMTKSETKLLSKLLKNGGYCINSEGDLSFSIISKQEKIYDATFASLIDENYNAKSVTPVTYFGECN